MGVDIESHSWFDLRGVETFVCREGRQLASSDGGVLEGHYHREGGQLTKTVHEGEKHIPAPKAVVLYDGKGAKDPPGRTGRRGRAIIEVHYRALPGSLDGAGEWLGATRGSGPPAPGVGRKTEGGAKGRVRRGVTTSKAGRSLLTVGGAEGLGVSATASPASSVVSMSPSAGAEVA